MDWNDVLGQVIQALLPIVVTLLLAGIAWLGKRIDGWLAVKVENEYLEGVLRRLNETTWTVVLELQQTEVEALKAATDADGPGGRKITPEEAADLKQKALDKLKDYLGAKGLTLLAKVLGLSGDGLDRYLSGNIESVVRTNKDAFVRSELEGGINPKITALLVEPLKSDTLRPEAS